MQDDRDNIKYYTCDNHKLILVEKYNQYDRHKQTITAIEVMKCLNHKIDICELCHHRETYYCNHKENVIKEVIDVSNLSKFEIYRIEYYKEGIMKNYNSREINLPSAES